MQEVALGAEIVTVTLAPVPVQAHRKMFVAIVAEALADGEVVAGMLLIGLVPSLVLFDSGCMHSFVSHMHVSRMGVEAEDLGHCLVDLGHCLVVTTLAGVVTITCRRIE